MSTYEQRDNSGSLFINDNREKDTHANARGTAMIDGVAYFVDAWTKTTKDGKKWQSLSFKRKDKQAGAKPAAPPQRGREEDNYDDPIPF